MESRLTIQEEGTHIYQTSVYQALDIYYAVTLHDWPSNQQQWRHLETR